MKKRPTKQEIEKIISQTDWDSYYRNVQKRVAKESEAYRLARVKSMESAHLHVLD